MGSLAQGPFSTNLPRAARDGELKARNGSEYPAVVIPLMMKHYMMLRRNLLYTGITRGRRLVVLVGQKQAVGMAVKGRVETRRWSKLGEWLA